MLAYHPISMFRLLTANLFAQNPVPAEIGSVLDRVEPDFFAVQELNSIAAEHIASRLPHGRLDPSDDFKGMGLAAREPLQVERFILPHRDALVAPGDITLWCVHLANPVDRRLPWWARRAQVRAIAREIADDRGALLLAGDLNATPLWPAYRRLTEHLDDGVAEWADRQGRQPERTWNYRPGWRPLLRIDHVLVRDLKVHKSFTVEIPGSDHRGVVVDFS